MKIEYSELLRRSALLDSPHDIKCAVRVHEAACQLPATHPRAIEHRKRKPLCDCALSKPQPEERPLELFL